MIKIITLKKSYEFRKTIKNGKYAVAPHISVYTLKNGKNHNRIGIVVKKTVGKSVVRNYIRRVIKENYRELANSIDIGIDIVVIARIRPDTPTYWDIKKELEYTFRKLRIFV